MKERMLYLDNLCAILIIQIIWLHGSASCNNYCPDIMIGVNIMLSFFMPWFFFKGGMMHVRQDNWNLMVKSGKRLLVPYMACIFIGLVIDMLTYYQSSSQSPINYHFFVEEAKTLLTHSHLFPTAVAWFLLSLFVSRVCFNRLVATIHPLVITIGFIILAYCCYLLKNNFISKFPFYIGNMCHGIAIYSLGFYFKEIQFNKCILTVSILLFLLRFFSRAEIDFRINDPGQSNYIIAVINGIAGCIVFNNLFKRFLNREIYALSYIGRNSMLYYLIHFPVMYIVINVFKDSFSSVLPWQQFCILSPIVILSLFIADYVSNFKKRHAFQ